jgi:hypothetical protein
MIIGENQMSKRYKRLFILLFTLKGWVGGQKFESLEASKQIMKYRSDVKLEVVRAFLTV